MLEANCLLLLQMLEGVLTAQAVLKCADLSVLEESNPSVQIRNSVPHWVHIEARLVSLLMCAAAVLKLGGRLIDQHG